ncbi:cation-translocating P-type ATPase [Candidatus Micrarchaeota archaeon]|nr:cation-translocating P-type ATPase [Candidatus Micrarchaeota archaeon]
MDFNEAIQLLDSNKNGLDGKEALKRLGVHGQNELIKKRKKTVLGLFIEQFANILILLLVVATLISLALGELLDAVAMFSIVMLSVFLGFFQEYRAEKAMEALEKITAPLAKVIRGGVHKKIPSKELVPGDIILLEAGDIVPADSRIFEESNLQIDEASLTGESVPSVKFVQRLNENTTVADQDNMAFAGTIVTYGKGEAIVTATGMNTEFGKIASYLQQEKDTKTPLQIKFEEMTKQIGLAVIILVLFVFISGIFKGVLSVPQMLIFSLSLAVAAIPSSLPAIVTISLAIGARELVKKKMIIRKLPAAESLGAVTVICSDKTGTITKNEMTVTKIYSSHEEYSVTGTGYSPEGAFIDSHGKEVLPEKFETLLKVGVLCNNSQVNFADGRWIVEGDPTEGALVVLGAKAAFEQKKLQNIHPTLKELPFDSERKMMSVVIGGDNNGQDMAYIKGATDLLVKHCDRILVDGKVMGMTPDDVKKILAVNNKFAENALRVLGFAYKDGLHSKHSIETVERKMVFVGLAGMIDPPRDEIFDAVKAAKEAGIKTIIITGDHALTSKAIAQKIGLFEDGDLVLTGEDIDKMGDSELLEKIENVRIFARTLPIQKSRIVDILKKKGHVVAMTGDGVNDAPALKKADIGISMGINGTDVAKEVSKATLADDNFATIVNAISEGRNIYDKIIKSSRYLLSCNAGEITVVFISIILNFPLPLIPMQILLMNLLTDGLPAIGLGLEKSEADVMKRKPRDPTEKPLNKNMILLIVIFGIIMGISSFALFQANLDSDLDKARTIAFTTLVMFQMFAAVGSRSLHPFQKLNIFENKWLVAGIASSIAIQLAIIYLEPLQPVFKTVALSGRDWVKILLVSSLGFIAMEVGKFFLKNSEKTSATFSKSPS